MAGRGSRRRGGPTTASSGCCAELDGVADRGARYVCVIVAIGPAGEEVVVRGTLEGAIATARSGEEGFGYDPIFVPDGEERTVAELGNDWKARNSHRARAAALLPRFARETS